MPLPVLQPMLMTTGEPGGNQDCWSWEVKWDGWRAMVYVDGGLRVRTRTGRQVADSLPELRGVSRCRDCARWQAYIHVDNKKLNLGLFPSEEAAALAYNAAATQWFKEFAHLNVL